MIKKIGLLMIIVSVLILPLSLTFERIVSGALFFIFILILCAIGFLMYSTAYADEVIQGYEEEEQDESKEELKPLSDWEQAYLTAIKSRKKESKEREDKR